MFTLRKRSRDALRAAKKKALAFEYRVIEKKYPDGGTYYIGESMNESGDLEMLTSRDYGMDRYYPPGYLGLAPPPKYMLAPKLEALRLHGYRPSYEYYKFKDPCKVKEIICSLRKESRERRANRNHDKVVSEGLCKC